MENTSMKKSLSFAGALALVIGMVIGSGIFLKPGIVLKDAGSPAMSIAAWVVAGIITLAAALTVVEIAAVIPKSGGLYTYLEELYDKRVGFLVGWIQAVISYPASMAAQSIAFAIYASFFIPLTTIQQRALAIGILLFLVLMNIISTKFGGIIQIMATIGKLIPVIAIIGVGLTSPSIPGFSIMAQSSLVGAGFGAAILGTLWAYDGWIAVTNMAGEIKNPSKTLPKVITVGLLFIILVYVAFNLVVFRVLPLDEIANSATPGADAAVAIFGAGGGALLTAGIMISVFGSLNGFIMTGARVPQAMGERNQLPFARFFEKIHPKFGTPSNALIIEAIIAILYIFSGTFNTLTDLLVFVLWIFFTMGVGAVFILRKRQAPKPGVYKVPLYPITPIVGVLGGLYIIISTLISAPMRSLIGIAITLAGLPVYYYINRKAK